MKIGGNNFICVCPSAILLSRRIHNKTHLSTVVNCRTVNNRHVDYRFYATTSDFFHRSLDLLHYTWYWRLHYHRPLQATQAEFYLLLANRSTAGVSAGGETRWLLRANPQRCELTWSRQLRLAWPFVPLTLYHRLLSSNREFTSTDRPEDRYDSLSP